jgi:hypothetical protein
VECSYCKGKMSIVTVRVKRPVPPGVKDLGLSDDVICWQCSKCEQISKIDSEPCPQCGGLTYKLQELPHLLLVRGDLDYRLLSCTNCQKCHFCKQPLKTLQYKEFREHDAGTNTCTYYHLQCHAKEIEETEAKTTAYKQECKRHEDEQAKRQREGLCLRCGKPLSMMDKISSRKVHNRC